MARHDHGNRERARPMISAPPTFRPTRHAWLILLAGVILLFVFLLGTRGLNEPDEGRYANIAQAMAKPGGDWWEPRMSGYGHYDKPPLVYWVTAASFRAFGLNEWAARVPSLLGALLALAGVGWTAYRLRGAGVAWWAVFICGTSVQFWTLGRVLSPDMLLTGWCTLTVAAWAEGRHRAVVRAGGGAWGWWLLSLAGWTLAWWTKATPALVPLLGLTLGVLITRDAPGRRALKPLLMFPAVIVLGSPWYLSMLAHYPELKKFFFGRELAGRLAGRVDGRHGSPLYYLPISLGGWLPWWPLAAWAAWRERTRWFAGPARALAATWTRRLGVEGWIVVTGLVILSLTASKLPTYTLTLAPWAALLMARAVARVWTKEDGTVRRWMLAPGIGFALVVLVGLVVLPPRLESRAGVNSSLREVCRYLQRQGARRVDTDRYCPGLEFYLGEDRVRYILRLDDAPQPGTVAAAGGQKNLPGRRVERYHERASDPGIPPDRFVDPLEWREAASKPGASAEGSWWVIQFARKEGERFNAALLPTDPTRAPVKVARIGHFDLYRLP